MRTILEVREGARGAENMNDFKRRICESAAEAIKPWAAPQYGIAHFRHILGIIADLTIPELEKGRVIDIEATEAINLYVSPHKGYCAIPESVDGSNWRMGVITRVDGDHLEVRIMEDRWVKGVMLRREFWSQDLAKAGTYVESLYMDSKAKDDRAPNGEPPRKRIKRG